MSLALNLANCAIFLLILVGTFLHHRRRFHVRTMILCFVLDLLLLCAVEFIPEGSAVQKAMGAASGGATEGRTLLLIHVGFSISTLLLWIVQLVVGMKVLKGRMELLPAHAKGAKAFLLVRLGNLVTAFMV